MSANSTDKAAVATAGLLWESDTGTLSFDSRRALVQLLQGPLVQATHHRKVWQTILSDEVALRQRLSELFLDLIVDEDAGIAFTRMAAGGVPVHLGSDKRVDMPKVLRAKALTLIDTVILLYLRTQLGLALPGERVIVTADELRETTAQYRRIEDYDEAGFNRRFNASLKRIRSDYNLLSDTETEGRFEVSPVLRHMFDAQTVAGIKAEFQALLTKEEQ